MKREFDMEGRIRWMCAICRCPMRREHFPNGCKSRNGPHDHAYCQSCKNTHGPGRGKPVGICVPKNELATIEGRGKGLA